MVCAVSESECARNRKLLLGIGCWLQGFRCFPWLGVNFFFKDCLRVEPSTLQILQTLTSLPMVVKPFYGVLSDSFYIFGQHRVPYIALGAFLQAVSWIAIAIFATSGISLLSITFYLLLGNIGASIVEVANDAVVAETAKQQASSQSSKSSSSDELQSFVWIFSSLGGVLGNIIGGIAIDQFSPQMMFLIFGTLLCFQVFVTLLIRESSLDLPKNPSHVGFRKQFSGLLVALKKPEILHSIIWFAFSYAVIPGLPGMFYYQTQHLKIKSSLLGISKVFGQAATLLWGVVYNRYLKSTSPRKLIVALQFSMAIIMISDFLFVKGVYQMIGLTDCVYVLVFSAVLEVVYFFKILPFSVLMAQLCPSGCEGSVMAFVMSAIALAFMVSSYLGVALASCVGLNGDDFSGMPRGLLTQAVCTLLPILWASCIPADVKSKTKSKKN